MIFLCNSCGKIIDRLTTPGDEVNKDLICPVCANLVNDLLKEARKIQVSLMQLFDRSA